MQRLIGVAALSVLSACGLATNSGSRVYVAPSVKVIDAPTGDSSSGLLQPPSAAVNQGLGLGRSVDLTPLDQDFVRLLNNARLDLGAGALTWDQRLDRAAQNHANDMAQFNYFSHQDRLGNTSWERAIAEGYQPRFVAENLLKGSDDVAFVFDAWQNSPDHRRNQLDPRAEDYGMGISGTGYNTRWVLVLGAELD